MSYYINIQFADDVVPSQPSEHEDNTSMLSQPASTTPNERPSLETCGQESSSAMEHDMDNNELSLDTETTPLLGQTDQKVTNVDDQADLLSDHCQSINLSISSLSDNTSVSSSEQREGTLLLIELNKIRVL